MYRVVYIVCTTVYVHCVYVLCVQVSVGTTAAPAAAPAGKAKVYGPALEKAVKTFESTYLIVDCKQAAPQGYYHLLCVIMLHCQCSVTLVMV